MQDKPEKKQQAKLKYENPKLIEYGSLADLTRDSNTKTALTDGGLPGLNYSIASGT